MKIDNDKKELTISEIQQASLAVLVELDSICRSHNLSYSLTYGTLIGAIRHKGFIPWDDDVDIIMPRADYEKLKSFFKSTYHGKLIWCDRTTIHNYPYCIARVSDLTYRYKTNLANEKDFDIGVFVDIYPLDNYCDTKKQALRLGRKVWFKNRMFDMYLNPNKTRGFLKKIIRNVASIALKLIYGKNWHLRIDNEIKNVIDKNTGIGNHIVGVISQTEWRELMERDWFANYIEMAFEGKTFMVCVGYDQLLKSIYGDYMKLPEKEKRVPTHNYTISVR